MNPLSRGVVRQSPQNILGQSHSGLCRPSSPSVVAYRRAFSAAAAESRARVAPRTVVTTSIPQLRSSLRLDQVRYSTPTLARGFRAATRQHKDAHANDSTKGQKRPADDAAQETQQDGDVKDGSARAGKEEAASGSETAKDGDKQEGEQGDQKAEGGEEGKDGKKKEKQEDLPPPPPHGDKTPWQVFRETMNSEFERSKEWNDTTKAIASSAHEFTESESVRRARQAYIATSSAASGAVKTTAGAIGKGAVWTWDTPVVKGVRKAANVTGDAVEKATRPIRETEAYKNVRDVIDDGSSSRYGGWVEKEERRKKREAELLKQQLDPKAEPPQENPDAGTKITLHKDAKWKEAWLNFRDSNRVVQGFFTMGQAYQESENPLVSTARSITDRITGFFAENETAQVIKKFRETDPGFQVEEFLSELREYILPEVLDAYVKGDTATLKLWLSAAQFSVYEALTKQYQTAGLKSDGRITDIRNVDILKARMLENDIPVFVITCRTQEVHVYRNAKSGELAAGMEDKVQLVTYAIGLTRVPEDVSNPETRGWRFIEMQKSGRDWY